jgi:hypothetical protein
MCLFGSHYEYYVPWFGGVGALEGHSRRLKEGLKGSPFFCYYAWFLVQVDVDYPGREKSA